MSLPARGVWVEIIESENNLELAKSLPARGVWVEIRRYPASCNTSIVTPREGSVG